MLASLLSLNADETNELSTAISMKLGHKRMFGIAVEEARKEKDEQEQKRKREKSKQQKEEELAEQLCEIKRKQKLAKARRRDVDSISTAELTAPAGLGASTKSKIGHKGTELPATKAYAAFLSHKKMHTTHGEMSETLALRIKDMLKWRSIEAYFDIDNLSTISKEKLKEGVEASCCLLLVLNDETLQ